MNRSQFIKKLVEMLEPWESSKLDENCAGEILDLFWPVISAARERDLSGFPELKQALANLKLKVSQRDLERTDR